MFDAIHNTQTNTCVLYIKLSVSVRPKITTTNTKVDRREVGRERKALKAAQLEKAIENELLERLKQVSESEIYNYPEQQYKKVLNKVSETEEGELIFISLLLSLTRCFARLEIGLILCILSCCYNSGRGSGG